MATNYWSTQDTTNFARIVRCIIGPCTEMLRDLLRKEVDPNQLKQLVDRALDKRKELTFYQRQKLCLRNSTCYNITPDYKKFDISLLYILFRTKGICQNIVPPSNGWGKSPLVANQTTMGDDIERLRLLKDDICSHAHYPAIFTPKYCQKMTELKDICARFDQLLGKKFHDSICQIETMVMDPEIAEQYAEIAAIVHELEKKDIANDRRLADVEENMENTDNLYERLESLVIDIQGKVEVLQDNGETQPVVRPAEALYPERILRREDDIRIKRNYSYLLEQINPVLILEKVHQKGIISSSLKEEITECHRRKHQTDRILKSLLRSSPGLYDAFHTVLKDGTINHGNAVKQLEDADTAEKTIVTFEGNGCKEEMSLRLMSNKRRIYDEVNTDDVVHCFLENEIINLDEHSKVFYEQFRRNRIENLLNQVLLYLPWSYQIFVKSLKDHHQYQLLVKQIEKTDVQTAQKGNGTLKIGRIDVTTTSTETTNRRETSITFDLQTENAGQINDEIVSKKDHLQAAGSTTELLHGYVENVEHGSVKITFSAASRLFWTKLKKLCDSGKIGEFIKNIIEEDVNLTLLPEKFTVHFEIYIDPCIQPESGEDNPGYVEVQTNLSDSHNLLVQEIDFQVITADLFEAGVIDDKNMFKTSDDPVRDLLLYLDQKERHSCDKFIQVLQKLGYSYIANVLLEKDIEVFNNIAADDIRVIILENYTMLLDELEFELLMKASTHLSSLSNSVLQQSDGTRRNKVHWLLKSILQGKSNILRAFLKSLNYAGYQHILHVFKETIEKLPLLRTSDGEELLSQSIMFKGQIEIENKNYDSVNLMKEAVDVQESSEITFGLDATSVPVTVDQNLDTENDITSVDVADTKPLNKGSELMDDFSIRYRSSASRYKFSRTVHSISRTLQTQPEVLADHYKLDYPRRGKALIICNTEFRSHSWYPDSKQLHLDASVLHHCLAELDFDVDLVHDQTVQQMLTLLKHAAEEDHSDADCFACAILTYGEEGGVFGVDGKVEVNTLMEPFKGNKCKTLAGKPKLFFIETYIEAAEINILDNIDIRDVQIEPPTIVHTIPAEADFLVSYSDCVVPEERSWMSATTPSRFTQILADMLVKHGREMDLIRLLTHVNEASVADKIQSKTSHPTINRKKQIIPCFHSTLTKQVYFPQKD